MVGDLLRQRRPLVEDLQLLQGHELVEDLQLVERRCGSAASLLENSSSCEVDGSSRSDSLRDGLERNRVEINRSAKNRFEYDESAH